MPIEARLSAYIDGEVTREEKEEIERLIASDVEARRIFDSLKHGSEVGRRAFDEVLKEPVPLALVRSIKSTQPPKAKEAQPVNRPSLKLAPTGKQALAASLILFCLGGGLGYMLGLAPGVPPTVVPIAQPATRTWLDDLAASHRIFAHQQRHIAEIPASDTDEATRWLTESVGVKFNLPDLAGDGLVFQGARLLVAAGKPVGELIYKTAEGDIIAIGFMKDSSSQENGDFNEVIKDDIGIVSWHRKGIAYAVIGPSSDAMLEDFADRVAAEI